ncbi:protein kinase [Actinosynnema sp. NPDC020468]|uniref:protein kinase domain-containing protein n=1 Tax=Actinosynnema sp. NPDC020468 TaxID=3154488 RepID=UPI0033F74161
MHLPGLTDLTPLGQGGFATVYRARQVQLNREVAVKIDNRVLQTERDRRRFLREAHAAARLSGHPHVVSVHDADFTPSGTPYLVMELCAGGSLADLIRRDGPLPAERVRQLGVQLADALAAAHAEGVLHRDIKPGNILLDRYGTAKLADFGLAALLDAEGSSTVTRDALSPSYAPPEAFAMAQPTPAADVYALAATLYDLLAGKPPRPVPWPIDSFDHLGEVLRSPVPPVAGVPAELHAVLVRGLQPEVSHRTPSAARLRDELSGVAALPTPAQPLAPIVAPAVPNALPAPTQSRPFPPQGHYSAPPQVPQQGHYSAPPNPYHSGPPPQYASQPVRRRNPLPIVLAVVLLVAVTAVGGWWFVLREKKKGTNTAAGQSTTRQVDQPADDLPPPRLKACGPAYCVAEPSCFHGITTIGGTAATARRAPDCATEHYWEAFAGGWLSGPVPKVDADALATSTEVVGVCTTAAMKANTRPNVDTTGWEITAVGFAEGDRNFFYCMAAPAEGGETTTSAFGSS